MNDNEKKEIITEITELINTVIKENSWEKLTSEKYNEYITATEIGKEITINKRSLLEKFKRAMNKGLEYVSRNEPKTIAEAIIKQFPDTKINDLRWYDTLIKEGIKNI